MGVQFWQEISKFVTSFIYQWSVKKCEETNSPVFASWFTGVYPGSSFPRSFLNYMAQPCTTQVMALLARGEQYALFLTPIHWTTRKTKAEAKPFIMTFLNFQFSGMRLMMTLLVTQVILATKTTQNIAQCHRHKADQNI